MPSKRWFYKSPQPLVILDTLSKGRSSLPDHIHSGIVQDDNVRTYFTRRGNCTRLLGFDNTLTTNGLDIDRRVTGWE